jgi:hypothetical protein
MREFARTAKRAAVTAVIGLALAVVTAGPAAATEQGPILVYKGTFSTKSACHTAGIFERDQHGVPYQCSLHNGKWDLYLIYY